MITVTITCEPDQVGSHLAALNRAFNPASQLPLPTETPFAKYVVVETDAANARPVEAPKTKRAKVETPAPAPVQEPTPEPTPAPVPEPTPEPTGDSDRDPEFDALDVKAQLSHLLALGAAANRAGKSAEVIKCVRETLGVERLTTMDPSRYNEARIALKAL